MTRILTALTLFFLVLDHLGAMEECPAVHRLKITAKEVSVAMKHEHGHSHTPWLGIYQDNELVFSTHVFANPATDGLEERIEAGEIGRYAPTLADLVGGERAETMRQGKVYVWLTARSEWCPPCARIAKDLDEVFQRFRCADGAQFVYLDLDLLG